VRTTRRAKLIIFGEQARRGLERGMNILTDTVKVTLGPGAKRRAGCGMGRANHHQ
jgi:hypothetical protein